MKRFIFTAVLIAFAVLSFFPAIKASAVNTSPAVTNNEDHWNYWTWHNWSQVVNSYLYDNGSGITRVEYTGSCVTVESYDSANHFINAKSITCELPLFGGFFCGSEYNYLVFGQSNPNENDNVEVIRTVKYSKDWQRLGHASIYGANTTIPFDAGSLRMDESGAYLFVRTCHEMYAYNGVNHQANLTYTVNTNIMEVVDIFSIIWNIDGGYVSHSFNQFIKADGNKLIALDHGDAHPRSAALIRYNSGICDSTLQSGCNYVNTVSYPGTAGDNTTNACVGGFELTSKGYMTAGNSNILTSGTQRNIYITITDRNNFSSGVTKITWLTHYSNSGNITLSNPQLVKVNDDKLLVIWKENSVVKYVFVDGSGNIISDTVSDSSLKLSDCLPIVTGNRAVWYVTSNSTPVFYSIKVSDEGIPGDANGDGSVNMDDALLTMRFSMGIVNSIYPYADIDGNGTIDSADALQILRFAIGIV